MFQLLKDIEIEYPSWLHKIKRLSGWLRVAACLANSQISDEEGGRGLPIRIRYATHISNLVKINSQKLRPLNCQLCEHLLSLDCCCQPGTPQGLQGCTLWGGNRHHHNQHQLPHHHHNHPHHQQPQEEHVPGIKAEDPENG